MEKANFVILGSSGFIGQHIHHVLSEKNFNIIPISSRDINLRETSSVQYLLSHVPSKSIVIFAAAVTREHGDTLETMLDNILIAQNVSPFLEKPRVKKCLYLSTTDVYGYPLLPITEQSAIDPKTFYAAAKYTSEKILQITSEKNNFPLLITRINGIYGPGQTSLKYGPNAFLKCALEKQPIKIWGDGQELRDFLYVKDLANIIVSLTLSETTGIVNLASGNSRTFMEIIKQIRKIPDLHIKVTHQPRTGQKFDQTFDTNKLTAALPDFSFTPLEKGIRETYQTLIPEIAI